MASRYDDSRAYKLALHIPYLREILLFLGAMSILIPLFSRFRINPVLGYLIAGVIIGPHFLGTLSVDLPFLSYFVFTDVKGIQAFAELGVVFLMFSIGLELSIKRIWQMRKMIFGLGTLQVLSAAIVIGMIAWLWGNTTQAAILIGGCLALSSTAVVVKLLVDSHRFATPVGQTSFSILLLQDLAVVPLIILVSVFAAAGDGHVGGSILSALFKAMIMVSTILILGRLLLRPLFKFVTSASDSPEVLTALALLLVVGISSVTAIAGMSMALGAFLAGLMLAETEFRHQVESDMEPFKGLLLGLFFMSVGMFIDISMVFDSWQWIVPSVIGLLMIKTILGFLSCRAFGLNKAESLQTAMTLSQSGEFCFVILTLASASAIVPIEDTQFMLIVASLTILVTPFIYTMSDRVRKKLDHRQQSTAKNSTLPVVKRGLSDHIVIIGYGRVGQMVAGICDEHAVKYVALDITPHFVTGRTKTKNVFLGDARHFAVLKALKLDKAKCVILTPNDRRATFNIARHIKHYFPAIKVIARAKDVQHIQDLQELGVEETILETLEMSLGFGASVLKEFSIPIEDIHHSLNTQRERYLSRSGE